MGYMPIIFKISTKAHLGNPMFHLPFPGLSSKSPD